MGGSSEKPKKPSKARYRKGGERKLRTKVKVAGEKPGRPPYDPTDDDRAYVQRQRLLGDTEDRIAERLGISTVTLMKHFHYEVTHSTRDLLGNLAATAYQRALSGDGQMIQFLLRTKAGFVERKELTGADGAPLVPAQSMPPLLLVEYVDGPQEDAPAGG